MDKGLDTRDVEHLFKTVVQNGYCIGCGVCAAVSGTGLLMVLDEYGRFTVKRQGSAQIDALVTAVCPFAEGVPDENEIAKKLFGKECRYHNDIGYYISTYAGYVVESDFRERGSSGGMASWILCEILSKGLVDGVIHVHTRTRTGDDARIFHFQLSTTVDQIQSAAKSRYYPVEMSQVLKLVQERPGRYAIVGVPCFIKAVRLLMRQNQMIKKRIRFCLALVCGHLKSLYYSEMLSWQCGIEPGQLVSIDFRAKIPKEKANRYGIQVTGNVQGRTVTRSAMLSRLYGSDWGWGFFKYKSCDYCDDVFGETADITVGDAWLPQYVSDSKGTNIVVVRNVQLDQMIDSAMSQARLKLDQISVSDVALSQSGGLFHRRKALAYRLYLADSRDEWRPPKRIQPRANHLNSRLRHKHSLRPALSAESHRAFQEAMHAGNFSIFVNAMNPLVKRYDAFNRPIWKRLARIPVAFIRRILQKLGRKRHQA